MEEVVKLWNIEDDTVARIVLAELDARAELVLGK